MRSWILLGVLWSLLPIAANVAKAAHADFSWTQKAKLPVPEQEDLKNGLKVVWFLSDKIAMVDFVVLLESGYRNDPHSKSGVAQLLSQVLDRGSNGKSSQQIAYSVEKLGATRYISADDDSFTVGIHGLTGDSPALLETLSEIVLKSDLPEAEILREKSRTIDRWERIGDYATSLASIGFFRLITSGTSYARGDLQSLAQFKTITREDVLTYYKTHFTPANAVLMVVGNVDRKSTKKQITRLFGDWKGDGPGRSFRIYHNPKVSLDSNRVLLIARPGLTQAQIRMGFMGPLINVPEHYALIVANAMLGEYFNSRLNAELRDRLALTYGVSSSFNYSKEMGLFSISTSCRNEVVTQLLTTTIGVLEKFRSGPISEDEVRNAKEYLVGSFPLEMATLTDVASRWLAGHVYGFGPEYLNEFIPEVASVTPLEVQSAIQKYFDLSRLKIVIAGDPEAVTKSLRQNPKLAFKRVTAEELK